MKKRTKKKTSYSDVLLTGSCYIHVSVKGPGPIKKVINKLFGLPDKSRFVYTRLHPSKFQQTLDHESTS